MGILPEGEELMKRVNQNTIGARAPEWAKNIVANADFLKTARTIADLFGNLKDVPAVIVAAGPSLDKNFKYLKEVKGKACIVCIDVVLRKMLEAGIEPDVVVVTDSKIGMLDHFKDLPEYSKDLPLLADVFVNNKLFDLWKGKIYMYASSPIEGCALTAQGAIEDGFMGGRKIGRVLSGGCVTSMAFSITVGGLQCDPVIIIGNDCSYTEPTQTHANEVNPEKNPYVQKDLVKDIYERNVITDGPMKAYAYWMERMVMAHLNPNHPVANGIFINATEGGIIQKGWLIMEFKYVINKYLKKTYKIKEMLNKKSEAAEDYKKKETPKVKAKAKANANVK